MGLGPKSLKKEFLRHQEDKQVQLATYIDTSVQYKVQLTSVGLHPCLLHVALLCRPIRIRKDPEVSQQCVSSTTLCLTTTDQSETLHACLVVLIYIPVVVRHPSHVGGLLVYLLGHSHHDWTPVAIPWQASTTLGTQKIFRQQTCLHFRNCSRS